MLITWPWEAKYCGASDTWLAPYQKIISVLQRRPSAFKRLPVNRRKSCGIKSTIKTKQNAAFENFELDYDTMIGSFGLSSIRAPEAWATLLIDKMIEKNAWASPPPCLPTPWPSRQIHCPPTHPRKAMQPPSSSSIFIATSTQALWRWSPGPLLRHRRLLREDARGLAHGAKVL